MPYKQPKLIGFYDLSDDGTQLTSFNKPDYTIRREKNRVKKIKKNNFAKCSKPIVPSFPAFENNMFSFDFNICQLKTDNINNIPENQGSSSNVIAPSENNKHSFSPISEGSQNEKGLFDLDSQLFDSFEVNDNFYEVSDCDTTFEEMFGQYFQCDLF